MTTASKPERGRLMKLEALRGFAATYVMASHIGLVAFEASPLALRFAQTAVMLFFVLSGFVMCYSIGYVTEGERPRGGFRDYFIKRARRIYPLFLITMVVGYMCASYVAREWLPVDWAQVLGNVFMVHGPKGYQPGVWFNSFHVPPLWSLAYEWWFYMLFYPLLVWNAPWWAKKYVVFALAVLAIAVTMMFPNQPTTYLLMFPIWWAGVELAREYQETRTVTFKRQFANGVLLCILTGMYLVWWRVPRLNLDGLTQFEKGEFIHYASTVGMLLIGIAWHRLGWVGFRWILGPFVVLAPISYAIYVFHAPILDAAKSMLGPRPWLVTGLVIPVTLLLSYLMEGRFQKVVNRVTNGWLGGRGGSGPLRP